MMAPMPTARIDASALAQGGRALGLALTPAQCETLVRYSALLLKWNRTHNLTAIERADEVLTHHLLDSLALVPHVSRLAGLGPMSPSSASSLPPASPASSPGPLVQLLDVGSGGGLPAVPLAIACPWLQVTAVDKVQKKVAFLTQVRVELGLSNLSAVATRVETWQPPQPFALIVARAFASLADFVTLTRHLLAPDGRWLAMKGQRPEPELAELAHLPQGVEVVSVQPIRVPGLDQARHLIEMKLHTP
jgi:16S rRNA (guanine527-N7)-methyltransferase